MPFLNDTCVICNYGINFSYLGKKKKQNSTPLLRRRRDTLTMITA